MGKRKSGSKPAVRRTLKNQSRQVPEQIDPRTGLDARIVYERRGKENVRCTFLYAAGNQCKATARMGYILCYKHAGPSLPGSGKGNGIATGKGVRYHFNTERWDDFYQRTLNNPEWNSLKEEVALIRTASQMTLEIARRRLEKADSLTKDADIAKLIRAQITAADLLNQAAHDVAEVVEKAAKVQKLVGRTIDVSDIDAFLEIIACVLHQEISDTEVLARIALRVRDADVPSGGKRPISDWPEGSVNRKIASVLEATEEEEPDER